MADRYKRAAIAMTILGLVLLFGGFTVLRSGDFVDRFPIWLHGIGAALIGGGGYLYIVSRP